MMKDGLPLTILILPPVKTCTSAFEAILLVGLNLIEVFRIFLALLPTHSSCIRRNGRLQVMGPL